MKSATNLDFFNLLFHLSTAITTRTEQQQDDVFRNGLRSRRPWQGNGWIDDDVDDQSRGTWWWCGLRCTSSGAGMTVFSSCSSSVYAKAQERASNVYLLWFECMGLPRLKNSQSQNKNATTKQKHNHSLSVRLRQTANLANYCS